MSPKRYLLANEYGTLSWGPYNQSDIQSYLGENPKERKNEKEQNLPPHQYLRLQNSPPIDVVMDLENHHKELRRKRNAYVKFSRNFLNSKNTNKLIEINYSQIEFLAQTMIQPNEVNVANCVR